MSTIAGYIGEPSNRIGILKIQLKPAKYVGIQKYTVKQTGNENYIKTPLPDDILNTPDRVATYLKNNHRSKGWYTTKNDYETALQSKDSRAFLEAFNTRIHGEYSHVIKKGPHGVSFEKLQKYIIPLAVGDDVEFMRSITR